MVSEAPLTEAKPEAEAILNELRLMGPNTDRGNLLKRVQGIDKGDKETIGAIVAWIEQKVAENEKVIATLQKEVETQMEEKRRAGEYVKPEAPTQPGWENPELRKALRNMRDTKELALWYRYAPEIFQNEQLTETIMQGVWVEVRKSDEFDSGFKEEMRIKKRQYVMYSADLTMGFDPNATKKLHRTRATELDNLRKLANEELTKFGPELYFEYYNGGEDTDGGRHENIGKRYQELIAAHNASLPANSPDRVIEVTLDGRARYEVRYNAGMSMYDQVSQNLADDEFTLMPGILRDMYVVRRNMEEGPLGYFNKRDLDDKIPLVEFFITEFKNDILGRRPISKRNALLFPWFANKAGQNFIPFENINPELKDWYEIIKALVGRAGDARAAASTYPKVKNEPFPVMDRINQLRKEENIKRASKKKPPLEMLTEKTQPFGRYGVAS